MAHLNISLFGYPAIELDETPVAVDERKAVALLAYLAVSGTPQSREALGAFLWPEHDQAQSYASLRHALWSLKHAGLAAWLETGRDAVALRSGYRLDIAEFQQALQARQFDAAAALYRADFLAGFTLRDAPAFDEWQFFQAEHLRQALAAALQQLVAEHCDRGDYQPGIAYARRWLALDPLHEPAHRQLMQLYAWAGQQTAALRQYQECARLLREELASAPEDETTALFETIRAKKLVSPALLAERSATPAPLGNIPRPLTSFIGRAQAIAAVMRLLATSTSRLVTLTGSGGCGKTRLALQVGLALPAEYPQGVWFVELAPLADPALVPQAVATSLGVREEPGRPILATLVDFLRARKALLILDNCEHLIDGCARLAESLLHACVEVYILATSREALGIAGETVFRVPSLSIPDPQQSPSADVLLQYEAVRLFVERAATALPGFTVTGDNAAALARICRRLDGIPLAIELAAARVTALRVEQIDARLVETFDLLTGGSRTALPRQQTLRATMEWSYALLSEVERVLLRRLAVFAGGWTLEAAEAVIGDWRLAMGGDAAESLNSHLQSPILDGLAALVNKSLVIVEREQGEEARYRLLETIRQYAREKLFEAGEEAKVQKQHFEYFLALAERAEPELCGPDQVAWFDRLEDEMDNVHAALEWALERDVTGSLRLASALWRSCDVHGYISEELEWLSRLLVRPEALPRSPVRAKALNAAARLMCFQGDFLRARSFAEEGLEIYRDRGDSWGEAFSLYGLATAMCMLDDRVVGQSLLLESLALSQSLGDKQGVSHALIQLGELAGDNTSFERACAYLEEGLALCKERGDAGGAVSALGALGKLALWQGDFGLARAWLEECMAIRYPVGRATDGILFRLGQLELYQGDYAQARVCFEKSLSRSKESGYTLTEGWALVNLGYTALREGDEASARATFAETQRRFQELGSKIGVVYTLEGFASLAVRQGRHARAVRLFAWADAMREAIPDSRPPVEQADVDRDFACIRTQLDETAIAAAHAASRAMTTEQAVAEALEVRAVDAEKPAQAVAPSRYGG